MWTPLNFIKLSSTANHYLDVRLRYLRKYVMPENYHNLRIFVNEFITEIKQKLTEETNAGRNGKYLLQGHVTCRDL